MRGSSVINSARKRGAPHSAASTAVAGGSKRNRVETGVRTLFKANTSSAGDEFDELAQEFDDGASHIEEPHQVILAFLHEQSRAGVAYYSSETGALSANATVCTDADVGFLIEVIKKQVIDVTAIVASSRVTESARLELGKGTNGEDATFSDVVPVHIVKHATFNLALCRKLLEAVCPESSGDRGAGGGGSSTQSSVRMASLLDSNDPLIIRVAGGLLHYLVRNKIVNEMEHGDAPIVLHGGLRMFNISDMMMIDTLSFTALSIFAEEGHPSVIKGSGKAKEGFSVCALLDRTVSTGGKKLLRSWCRQPSTDLELLHHRHDAVEFGIAARTQLPEIWKEYRSNMKHVKDIPRLLLQIKTVRATPRDWAQLHQSVVSANMLKETTYLLLSNVRGGGLCEESSTSFAGGPRAAALRPAELLGSRTAPGDPLSKDTPYSAASPFLLRQVLEEFSNDLSMLQSMVDEIIDWDATKLEKTRLCVKLGLDTTLDQFRRAYEDLPAFLSAESIKELEKYPSLYSLSMKYVPQIGCVAVIDKADNGLAPATADVQAANDATGGDASRYGGIVPMATSSRAAATIPPDFQLQFETKTALHYKTPRADEIDTFFGDIATVIADLEGSIVRQLESQVLQYENLLQGVGGRLAELDVLAAFSETSQDFRYVRPKLVDDNVLLVKNARHPLQELTVDTFVPNDIALAPGQAGVGAVAICTGPNFSGKSVYLKTVGLIPYMAQIGCFVPAGQAVLGIVDRMFTRIHSLETASVNQSSFCIDLGQIGLMLRHATPRSLLLIDEFGKGTTSIDGVSLLAATIRSILSTSGQSHAPPLHPVLEPDDFRGGGIGGAISGDAAHASGVKLLPPKAIITTHFREVFDLDLLGISDVTGNNATATASGSSSSSESTAPSDGLTASCSVNDSAVMPLSAAASAHIAFYQMSVILDSAPSTSVSIQAHFDDLEPGGGGGSGADQNDEIPEFDDQVVPLFKLVPGRATSSYGHACARKAGVSPSILLRAHEVTDSFRQGKAIPPRQSPATSHDSSLAASATVLISSTGQHAPTPSSLPSQSRSMELTLLHLARLILEPAAEPAGIVGGLVNDEKLWTSPAVNPSVVYTAIRAIGAMLS